MTLTAAKPKMAKLAKKLLYGDQPTRAEAVKAFNKLPVDAQYDLVPDFMVALTDDNPEVRKIASRILKAMGLTSETQIPDVKTAVPTSPPPSPTAEKKQLADEKASQEAALQDDQKELPAAPPKSSGQDQWADLKKMREDDSGNYPDLKQEIDREKKGQIELNVAELQSDAGAADTPLSTVIDALKDPTPWVHVQAARRLAMIHPAPVETIPTLIDMLGAKDPESRRAAAAALGSFGSLAREAVPALNKALTDPDDSVSLIAADALKQIQQP
jgi:HEAT repeat protein